MIQNGTRHRWRNLGTAAGAATASLFAIFDLYQWAAAYASDRFHNDFTFYFAAARIGLTHGWPSIYDLNLQQAELDTLGSGIKVAELARYISPPPLAWSALPFTALPSHRTLALLRGEKEEVLDLVFDPESEPADPGAPVGPSSYEIAACWRARNQR